jgi:hypothetical protein
MGTVLAITAVTSIGVIRSWSERGDDVYYSARAWRSAATQRSVRKARSAATDRRTLWTSCALRSNCDRSVACQTCAPFGFPEAGDLVKVRRSPLEGSNGRPRADKLDRTLQGPVFLYALYAAILLRLAFPTLQPSPRSSQIRPRQILGARLFQNPRPLRRTRLLRRPAGASGTAPWSSRASCKLSHNG